MLKTLSKRLKKTDVVTLLLGVQDWFAAAGVGLDIQVSVLCLGNVIGSGVLTNPRTGKKLWLRLINDIGSDMLYWNITFFEYDHQTGRNVTVLPAQCRGQALTANTGAYLATVFGYTVTWTLS